jgi:hypothetical protein
MRIATFDALILLESTAKGHKAKIANLSRYIRREGDTCTSNDSALVQANALALGPRKLSKQFVARRSATFDALILLESTAKGDKAKSPSKRFGTGPSETLDALILLESTAKRVKSKLATLSSCLRRPREASIGFRAMGIATFDALILLESTAKGDKAKIAI